MAGRVLKYAASMLVSVLAIAACSRVDPPSVARSAQPLAAPFNGLTTQSPAESARLQQALNILIASCMRDRSYYFRVPHPPTPRGLASNPYGLLAVSTASRWGYAISDNYAINTADSAVGAQAQPHSSRAGFSKALTGTPGSVRRIHLPGGSDIVYNSNGCVTIALDELYGKTWDKAYYTISMVAIHVVSEVEASAAWKRSVAIWAHCVRADYGRSFASPETARGTVSMTVSARLTHLSGNRFTEQLRLLREGEVRLATIDAKCQVQARLGASASQAQHMAEAPYEKAYANDLRNYRADLRHANIVAGKLLASKPRLSQ